MGTSTSYDAPPSWSSVKTEVTQAAQKPALSAASAKRLLRHYINQNGGPDGFARGSTGSGGRVGSSAAAREVARRLGGFLSSVGSSGLAEALRGIGLADLADRSVAEVLSALLDRLGTDGSTIDDVDARMALSRLQDSLLAEANTPEDVESILNGAAGNIVGVLEQFFAYYLYEQFCRVFYERLVQRVGELTAESFLTNIQDFILAAVRNRTTDRSVSDVDWNGPEGLSLANDILESTLRVFGA